MSRALVHTSTEDVLQAAKARLQGIAVVELTRLTRTVELDVLVLDWERARRPESSSSHGELTVPLHALVPLPFVAGYPTTELQETALAAAEALWVAAATALAPRGALWASARRAGAVQLALLRPFPTSPCACASAPVAFRVPQTL